ncbi:TerC family protein [Bacillus toyonensis]|uniref:TerC family protein n=1 Tax=Bacillus toyonensis TaxID=155322 RepID=UPI002E248554|nr:TerC family protein [Bacillus toyonensis]
MEIFGLSLVVLLKLIMIDIVLSGDNAVVIAMAARNVPKAQQKQAILWGTAGAIILRILLAGVIIWLLKIPYLTAIGGGFLIYIAIKLLVGEEGPHKEGGATVWSAVKTIIIADAVMSFDNVVALAGVAEGSMFAIIVGVAVSIPIIIFGSQIILKGMERFPIIIYIGSAILAWTAGTMIVSDPHLAEILKDYKLIIPILVTVVSIGLGYILQKKNLSNNK